MAPPDIMWHAIETSGMDEVHYLTAAEAAERLGISLRTVRRRIADGTLPAVRIGAAVRIPASALEAPKPAGHAAREAVVPHGTDDSKEDHVRRWNREHWPDTYENMLQGLREAIAEILALSKLGRPPAGPHDTADAILNQVRDEFGARLLQYLPPARVDPA
jgi:excisionase family DNA binding protein